MSTLAWAWLDTVPKPATPVIGTLGPTGTSSEQAAALVGAELARSRAGTATTALYATYEDAATALAAGEVALVVVANAYKAVHHLYMDLRFAVAGTFIMDTPLYGIARRRGGRPPSRPVIATHPSPVALIKQLLPAEFRAPTVVETNSTSAAAASVLAGEADLALTTKPAAHLHDLEFISPTRTIRMVWTIFAPAPLEAA